MCAFALNLFLKRCKWMLAIKHDCIPIFACVRTEMNGIGYNRISVSKLLTISVIEMNCSKQTMHEEVVEK